MEIQGEPLSQEFLNFSGQSTWTSSKKITSNLQLRVIWRIHKNATEVHSENNEKFKYYKECISNENKGIEN